jgi:hypothetical protein
LGIKNYTTSIDEHKTVAEIQTVLARKGAVNIQIQYKDGQPLAIAFAIKLEDRIVQFRLPCNPDGVFRAMAKGYTQWQARNRFERDPKSKQQARRTAWRIVKNWIEAQMAIVEAEQAQIAEVFLPYQIDSNGQTMFQRFTAQLHKALPSGEEEHRG